MFSSKDFGQDVGVVIDQKSAQTAFIIPSSKRVSNKVGIPMQYCMWQNMGIILPEECWPLNTEELQALIHRIQGGRYDVYADAVHIRFDDVES